MTKEILLTRDAIALVDDEWFSKLSHMRWKLCVTKSGHLYAGHSFMIPGRTNGKKKYKVLKMHRMIMSSPVGINVDHINGNGLDNRTENLRHATAAQNARNMRKKSNNNPYKGIHFKRGKWDAEIRCGDQREWLGSFSDPLDAAKAYDAAAIRLHGEFAKINFPTNRAGSSPPPVAVSPSVFGLG